jgi:hypothetical protein
MMSDSVREVWCSLPAGPADWFSCLRVLDTPRKFPFPILPGLLKSFSRIPEHQCPRTKPPRSMVLSSREAIGRACS